MKIFAKHLFLPLVGVLFIQGVVHAIHLSGYWPEKWLGEFMISIPFSQYSWSLSAIGGLVFLWAELRFNLFEKCQRSILGPSLMLKHDYGSPDYNQEDTAMIAGQEVNYLLFRIGITNGMKEPVKDVKVILSGTKPRYSTIKGLPIGLHVTHKNDLAEAKDPSFDIDGGGVRLVDICSVPQANNFPILIHTCLDAPTYPPVPCKSIELELEIFASHKKQFTKKIQIQVTDDPNGIRYYLDMKKNG